MARSSVANAIAEAISDDGRYVVFAADVGDLEDPTGAHTKTATPTVYVRDMDTGTTTAVSRANGPTGEIANEESQAYFDLTRRPLRCLRIESDQPCARNRIEYLRTSISA